MKIECSVQEVKELLRTTSPDAITPEEVQKLKTILRPDFKYLCLGLHEELKRSCQATIDGIE